MLMLAYVYGDEGISEEGKKWVYKAYGRIESMPLEIQLQILEVKAAVDKEPKELLKYTRKYLELNPYSTRGYYTIGWASYNTDKWQDAIDALEKGIELQKSFGRGRLWIWHYVLLGNAYHKTGQHDKEMKAYEDGLSLWPDQEPMITFWQTVCAISQGDTTKSNNYLKKIRVIGQRENWPEPEVLNWLAEIHYEANLPGKAEELYRRALMLDRRNIEIKVRLAHLLIKNNINVNEGVDLLKSSLMVSPDNGDLLFVYGSGLLKQGYPVQALEYLNRSWQLRPYYDHEHYLCLQEANKAVAGME
jgi:tetratricopeptide (TPR) repeat protein